MTRGPIGDVVRRIRGLAGAPAGDDSTDGHLLRRFADERDPDAFGELLRRHGPLVLAVCRRMLGDHHDAEDAFQATFLVLARRAGALDRRGTVAGWLYTVAYHIVLRAKAESARRREHERRAAPPEAAASDEPLWRDLRPVIDEELRRLPEKYRLPVLLCYLEGKTQEEVAALLGWSKGTVSGRLARARETLRGRLERRGLAPSASLLSPSLSAVATSAVPARLLEGTLAAAGGFAAGQAASGAAVALAQAAVRRMLLARAAFLAAGLLAVAVAAAGARLMIGSGAGPAPSPPGKEKVAQARVDRHGDPLPPGAVARLGTVRLAQGEGIRSAVFSPDNKLLASAGHYTRQDEMAVRIWDVSTGKERRRLPGAEYLAFSPDSRRLAASQESGRLSLWDVVTGKREWSWDVWSEKDARKFGEVAFAPDGKTLALAVGDGTVRLCSAATGKEERRIATKAHRVAFAPDGKTLATFDSGGKTVPLWEPATGRKFRDLAHRYTVYGLAFSPDSRSLVVTADGNDVVVWDVAKGKELRSVSAPGIGYPIRFSADGKQVRTGYWTLDLATGNQTRPLADLGRMGGGIALSANARLMACDDYGALRLWDLASKREVVTFDRHHGPMQYVIPSADGKTIRTVGQFDERIREWTAGDGRPLGATHMGPWRGLCALSADGKVMAIHYGHREFALRELPAGHWTEGGELGVTVQALALSADAGLLAVASGDKGRVIRLWNLQGGAILHTLKGKAAGHSGLTFSPDGKTLAGASSLDRVDLWDVTTGKPRHGPPLTPQPRKEARDGAIRPAGPEDFIPMQVSDPKAEPSPVAGMVFSPSGKSLAIMSGYHRKRWAAWPEPDAGLVRLYDVTTGKEIFQLAHQEAVVAFSPDGTLLATGGHGDHAVYLWDAATGKQRHRFEGHQGKVTSLAFTADGRRLISGSEDSTALVWDVTGK